MWWMYCDKIIFQKYTKTQWTNIHNENIHIVDIKKGEKVKLIQYKAVIVKDFIKWYTVHVF